MADDGELLPDKVRVNFAFDGHQLSNTMPWMWKPEGRPPAGLSRALMHAHGDDTMAWADAEYEVWPLPAGEVSITARWPVFHLGPVTVTLDGRLFLEAARRTRQPWENWPDESIEAFESNVQWLT